MWLGDPVQVWEGIQPKHTVTNEPAQHQVQYMLEWKSIVPTAVNTILYSRPYVPFSQPKQGTCLSCVQMLNSMCGS